MDVECTLATNGQECLEIYQKDPSKFNLILMVRSPTLLHLHHLPLPFILFSYRVSVEGNPVLSKVTSPKFHLIFFVHTFISFNLRFALIGMAASGTKTMKVGRSAGMSSPIFTLHPFVNQNFIFSFCYAHLSFYLQPCLTFPLHPD